jgi:hypothetical protein
VDGARCGAGMFVLAALRALYFAPLLVAVLSGYYPGRAGGEPVGEVARGPVRGWDVEDVGASAGAADEAPAGLFG